MSPLWGWDLESQETKFLEPGENPVDKPESRAGLDLYVQMQIYIIRKLLFKAWLSWALGDRHAEGVWYYLLSTLDHTNAHLPYYYSQVTNYSNYW